MSHVSDPIQWKKYENQIGLPLIHINVNKSINWLIYKVVNATPS